MKVLFIGDIVGQDALDYVVAKVPGLREEHALDLVIANAENCCVSGRSPFGGFGMDVPSVERLLASGVDVITSGNHAWDTSDADQVHLQPRVLRPYNLPDAYSGKGVLTLDVAGERVTVLNVVDRSAIPDAHPVYDTCSSLDLEGTVIVDFHGEDVMQKFGFAYAMDGRVAAVLGTHTHEPAETLHLLPGGTALVIDVGMTGPSGGWQGIDPAHMLAWYLGEDASGYPQYELAKGEIVFGAVLLEIEDGRTTEITRLH